MSIASAVATTARPAGLAIRSSGFTLIDHSRFHTNRNDPIPISAVAQNNSWRDNNTTANSTHTATASACGRPESGAGKSAKRGPGSIGS